jgi:steroid delta-isomerase-like uncharacterized protein
MGKADLRAFHERRQDCWSRHDVAGLAEGHTEDGVVSSPMFGRIQGRDRIEASYRALFEVFPDLQFELEPPIMDGDRGAQAFVIRATHKGTFMGLEGTGRRVEMPGVTIYTMRDGLIAEERRVYDFTGLLTRIGILKTRPAR